MLQSRKSLASYFDDQPDSSWYAQTEGLSAPPDGSAPFHDIPHFGLSEDEDDGLDGPATEFMGTWMWHPDHKKEVWVPDGVHSVFEKPEGDKFQEKGETEWAQNAWGSDDYKRRYNMSRMPKGSRQKETSDERKKRRDDMQKLLTEAREKAYETALSDYSAVPDNIKGILRFTEGCKSSVTRTKNEKIEQLKQGSKVGKEKNMELHETLVNVLKPTSTTADWPKRLLVIKSFCEEVKFENIVGTDLPPCDPSGACYLFVALSFLSQVKKQIMTCLLATARKKIAAKTFETTVERDATYNFVNYSYLANDLRKRLTKDKYPKKPNKDFADTPVMITWSKKVRAMERAAYKKLHPRAKIPKRLKDAPGKREGKKSKKGRGGRGDGIMPAVEKAIREVILGKGGRRNNQGKKKRNHHKQKEHTFGHEPRAEYYDGNAEGVPPPPVYRSGRVPGEAGEPWQQPNVQPYGQVASRLQRGYYY